MDGRADDTRIPAEVLLPASVTKDGNVVAAILLFAREEGASQQRRYTEYIEEMVAGGGVVQVDHLRSSVKIHSGKLAEAGEYLKL